MSSSSFMLRLSQPFVAHEVALDDSLHQLIFGSLSRPPELYVGSLSWRRDTVLVCTCSHPLLSRNCESGTMVYDDGVAFWISLASRFVHRQGEFCLRSIKHNHQCDMVKRIFKLCENRCCVFLHLKSLRSEADAGLLVHFGILRVILLVTHLFDGLYASVILAKILLHSLNSLDQVKDSAIIDVERMFTQSPLLAIVDHLVLWFIKFLPRLKKETSFFSCWLLHHTRYVSPNSVPAQRYIWSRRTPHSVYGVVSRELLLLLCASVRPLVSSSAYVLSHDGILNMELFPTELLHLEERFVSSRFLSNKEVFAISYTPATLQSTLLRVPVYIAQQMLKEFQLYVKSLRLQEGAAINVTKELVSVFNTWNLLGYLMLSVMLNANGNGECASQWLLDFSGSREVVVRLITLSGDMKKTTLLNCDTLCVSRRLPMLLELPYGSSPRPPDDHTSYIHPSNSNEDLKI